jgi:hypothetical protein
MNALRSTRSFASVVVLAAASLVTVAGCSPTSDDVYTADERSGDVGAVARGEVRFPLPIGSAVPDGSGVATTLTPSMRGVRVDLQDMYVDGTCDSDAHGEFYYEVDLDGRPIARRSRDDYQSAAVGDSISLVASRVFFVQEDEPFSLDVRVSEADDFLNGGDDLVGDREVTYFPSDVDPGTLWQTMPLGHGDCAVRVSYSLTRVQ